MFLQGSILLAMYILIRHDYLFIAGLFIDLANLYLFWKTAGSYLILSHHHVITNRVITPGFFPQQIKRMESYDAPLRSSVS